MALQIETQNREFILKKGGKNITLPDPDPNMSPDEVVKHYLPLYPELTNNKIDGPIVEGNTARYNLSAEIGRKG